MVKIDDTGLHADDCPCAKCEVGLGPTPLERASALRALAARRLAEAARAAEAAKAIKRAIPTREPPRGGFGPSRPYTQDENAELLRMRAAFRAGKQVSDASDNDDD